MAGAPAPPSTPNPLSVLSPNQIVRQATNSIRTAYKPAFQALDSEAGQAQALADKRSQDNKYFQSWLDAQTQQLQNHADAAHQALDQYTKDIANSQQLPNMGFTGTASGANAQLLAGVGQGLNEQVQGAATHALNSAYTGSNALDASIANSNVLMSNANIKNSANLDKTLTAIGNMRSKISATEGSDIAREIARLQGLNMQIAQSNRNYGLVAAKLGIAQQNANANTAKVGIAQQNANTSSSKAAWDQMNGDRKFQLDQQKYSTAVAKDLYQREHGLGPYKPSTAGMVRPLSLSSQNALYAKISGVQGYLRQLIANGASPQQAYHALLNGSSINVDTGRDTAKGVTADQTNKNSPVGEIYHTQTYHPVDVQLLNAAYNLETGKGLTRGDVAALKQMGLGDPGSRLKVAR